MRGAIGPSPSGSARTGRWPWAVVQLRQEDAAATAYNLVGFQSPTDLQSFHDYVTRVLPGGRVTAEDAVVSDAFNKPTG